MVAWEWEGEAKERAAGVCTVAWEWEGEGEGGVSGVGWVRESVWIRSGGFSSVNF